MASKGKNRDAAWELVKFLSSPAFANEFGAHYGWAPVRSDVNTSKGDAQVKRVNKYVLEGWDGLPTGPKMAQLTSVYGQAIEAAATGNKTVRAAHGQGPDGRHADPQELTGIVDGASEGDGVERYDRGSLGRVDAERGGVPAGRCPLPPSA